MSQTQRTILFEDSALLIINKPAGMLVHPVTAIKTETTLYHQVLEYYCSHGNHAKFHPVFRLDRNTSGAILIAKQPEVHAALAMQHLQGNLSREYLAVVSGHPEPPAGTITVPIARKPGSIIERIAASDGQTAITHFCTLLQLDHISLLQITLETGRTHQIRVHLSHIGCPLLGDDLYGGDCTQITRQALHSYRLACIHPLTKQQLVVTAPCPQDIATILPAVNIARLIPQVKDSFS